MVVLNFVIPLRKEADADLFTSIPHLNAQFGVEKSSGLTAAEADVTLILAIAGSGIYDVLKASVLAFAAQLRDYFSRATEDDGPLIVSFNGIQYCASSESDLKALVLDIANAVEERNADSDKKH